MKGLSNRLHLWRRNRQQRATLRAVQAARASRMPLFTAEQAEAFGVNRGNEWGGGR